MNTANSQSQVGDINKQFYNYLWAYILVALSGCLGNVVDGIIVGNLISASKAGLKIKQNDLEAHYLAGGHVGSVVNALISADKPT